MDTSQTDEVMEKIIDVLKCGVKSYGDLLLPILEDMIEKSLLVSSERTCRMTLKLVIAVFECIDRQYVSGLMKIFEATTTMTLNVLLGESNFKKDIVEKFFELANVVVVKFPMELMISPSVLTSIELAISTCRVDTKDANALKFLTTLLTVDCMNIRDYQIEIMSNYGEQIIFTLMYSHLFVFTDPSKLNFICDIFAVMKNASNDATIEILEKSLKTIPNRKFDGKIAINDKHLQEFLDVMAQ